MDISPIIQDTNQQDTQNVAQESSAQQASPSSSRLTLRFFYRPSAEWQEHRILFLILGMLAVGLVYLPSLFWSFGHDQYVFAEIGQLMLHGKAPYVDAWDIKPPNIFYLYTFAQALFGKSEMSIRLLDYLWTLLGALLTFKLVEKRTKNSIVLQPGWDILAATIAACLYGWTILVLGLADTAQAESFSLPLLLGALLLQSSNTKRSFSIFFAGILIAAATFFKTTNAAFLLALFIDQRLWGNTRKRELWMLFQGFFIGILAQVVVLLIEGSFFEFLSISYNVFLYHSSETQSTYVSLSDIFRVLWIYEGSWLTLLVLGLVLLIIDRKDRTITRRAVLPFTMMILCAAIGILFQRKGWGYHYVVLIAGIVPLTAVCSTVALQWIIRHLSALTLPPVAVILFFAAIATGISPTFERRYRLERDSFLAMRDHPAYLRTLGTAGGTYDPLNTLLFSRYLQHVVPQDSSIFILGQEPGAYWYSGLTPASRYIYTLLFTSPVMRPENFQELNTTLRQERPYLIAVETVDSVGFSGKLYTSADLLQTDRLEGLKSLLDSSYTPTEIVCKKFLIYRKK